jgi:hypothetical protein
MSTPNHFFNRKGYPETKTEEAAWTENRGNYVTLVLVSLALSLFITLIIGPLPYGSLFF